MKYRVSYSGDFKRDFKRVKRQGCDMEKLEKVLELLVNGEKLPPKYRDHKLGGEYLGTRECHIAPEKSASVLVKCFVFGSFSFSEVSLSLNLFKTSDLYESRLKQNKITKIDYSLI